MKTFCGWFLGYSMESSVSALQPTCRALCKSVVPSKATAAPGDLAKHWLRRKVRFMRWWWYVTCALHSYLGSTEKQKPPQMHGSHLPAKSKALLKTSSWSPGVARAGCNHEAPTWTLGGLIVSNQWTRPLAQTFTSTADGGGGGWKKRTD